MLRESFVYLRSYARTPPAFRPYLVDAIGLWARGVRQSSAWAPHLGRTRAVIETTMDDLTSRRTVAVLGSGPLFDVPLETLATTFKRVLLIDIAHLSTTDLRVGRHPNVERVWRDLSPAEMTSPLAFLATIPELDWVISVNLLSQVGRAAEEGRQRRIIDQHLDGLSALPMPVTLITDIDYRVLDRKGSSIEEFDMLHGRMLPPTSTRWLWEVAPFGEEAPNTRRVHTVLAYPDWHAAGRDGLVL